MRVVVIEPGLVPTGPAGHLTGPAVRDTAEPMRTPRPEDIANAVIRPGHVAVDEILVRPAGPADRTGPGQRNRELAPGPEDRR
ncbi:hypothetical protein ACWEEL_30695, partial [Streptomyces sp. NPDC005009]